MGQQLYITQEDVKAYMGIGDTNTSKDAFIQLMIPKIMAYVDKYTGRTFGWGTPEDLSDLSNYQSTDNFPDTVDGEVHDGYIGGTIWLNNMDIASVDEVTVGNPVLGSPTTLDPSAYIWRNDGRLILGGASFDSTAIPAAWNYGGPGGYQTISVKYRYGYFGVPEDIAMACLDIANSASVARQVAGIGSERLGNYQVSYDSAFRGALASQPDVAGVLAGYRRVRL